MLKASLKLFMVAFLALGLVLSLASCKEKKAQETKSSTKPAAKPAATPAQPGKPEQPGKPAVDPNAGKELPVKAIPGLYSAAEAYFSPDGKSFICNAKINEQEADYHVYTGNTNGKNIRRINDKGDDACSFFTPDGKKILFTSTRDNLDMPKGNYSDPSDYPQGAELYMCNLDGSGVKRLTNNKFYDAEVTMSPDGKWILFSRQVNGNIDLYKMRADGTGEVQITKTPELQEGGSFFMPDNDTIIFRAWKTADQKTSPKPMALYTIKQDGTNLKAITPYEVTNWAPFPSKDGIHVVFVKAFILQGGRPNFEIFLLNMKTNKLTQVTYSMAFDGFPALSPDGKTMMFSSSRNAPPKTRNMNLFLMDISSLVKD